MAKFKPAGGKKKPSAKSALSAIPCLIMIVAVIALVSLLFYAVLKSSF
jgi:hypothetical protein